MLGEGHILSVFQNKLLTKIFGHKRKETVGGWIELQNEKFYYLYVLLG
jgi:hypothetical protein